MNEQEDTFPTCRICDVVCDLRKLHHGACAECRVTELEGIIKEMHVMMHGSQERNVLWVGGVVPIITIDDILTKAGL